MALRRLATSMTRVALSTARTPFVVAQPVALRTISTTLPKYSTLSKALADEIAEEAESGTPANFVNEYNGFKIEQKKGSTLTTFTKELKGETVRVTANLNNCDMLESSDPENGGPEVTPNITIEISKRSGETLTFEASIDEGKMILNTAGISRSPLNLSVSKGETYFSDLTFFPENVYEGFVDYLADRGVDGDFISFVDGYVADKEYDEYLNFLEVAKKFSS